MSDDRVRALARAAEAAPHDVEAGRALAHALGRVGDREGARRELARLARLGDLPSLEALDALAPWPTATGIGRTRRSTCASVRTPGAPVPIQVEASYTEYARLVAATREVALVETLDGLAGVSLVELRQRWLAEEVTAELACALGDDAVTVDEGHVVVLRPDGRERGRVALEHAGRADELLVLGPDVVAVLYDEPPLPRRRSLVGLDLERFAVRWRRDLTDYHSHNPAGPWLVLDLDEGAEVVRADTGEVVARSKDDVGVLLATDARGLVTHSKARGLSELALPDLSERWRRPSSVVPGGRDCLIVTDELILHAERRAGRPRGDGSPPERALVAVERTTGSERWATPLFEEAVAVAVDDAVYVLDAEVVFHGGQGMGVEGGGDALPRSLHPRLAVRAFELADGAPRFEVELDRTWRPDQLQLVPFERGLLARQGPGAVWAVRDRGHARPADGESSS